MKVSIFLKSRKADFRWLELARDSIRKFCKGFHEVVLCLNEGESFDWPEANIVHVRESFCGYNFQQAIKLNADAFCSGDYILFSDSDVIFTREVTPDEFFREGKPIWIIRPYGEARSDQEVWRRPTSDFLGQDFPFEGMYRHPHVCPSSVLKRMRGFCQFKHGISMDEYIKSKCIPGNELALVFSEFNAIAAFGHTHEAVHFSWVDASKETPHPGCTFQSHTHGPEKEAHLESFKAKFREILGSAPETLPEPPKPAQTISEQIRTHVEALKAIVMESKAGRTQMLHQELRAAGLLGAAQVRKNRELVSA